MALQHPKNPYARARKVIGDRGLLVRGRARPDARTPRRRDRGDVAYQIVHDELMLDGNARLNLATFVTTWMDPQADSSWPRRSTRT